MKYNVFYPNQHIIINYTIVMKSLPYVTCNGRACSKCARVVTVDCPIKRQPLF